MDSTTNNVMISISLPDGTSFSIDSTFFEFAAIVWDRNNTIHFCSPRVETFFDYSPRSLSGKKISFLVDDNELEKISEITSADNLAVNAISHKMTCLKKDNSAFLTEWVTSSSIITDKNITLYLTVIRDLSTQRSLQVQLALQDKYTGMILDNTDTELWELYPEDNEITFKNNLRNLLGIQPDALIHKLEWYHSFIHKDDLSIVKSRFKNFVEGKAFEFNVEYRIRTGSGDIKWIRDIGARLPVIGNKKQPEFVGVIIDISKYKRNEQLVDAHQKKYKAIFDASYEALILLAPSGKVIDCNNTACLKLGYSQEQMLNLHAEKLIADIENHSDESVIKKLDTGENIIISEAIHENGSRFPIEIGGVPFKLDEDSTGPDTLLLVIHDISEKIKNKSDQIEFAEKLKKAQRFESLGILAGGIAHEFNNIFGGILGNAELAMMTVAKNGKTHKLLTKVHEATERAARVTQQMLAYSGQGSYDLRPLHLSKLVESMKSLIRASCSSMVDIHYNLDEDMLPFTADLAQMRQVVLNLVSNAAEAIGRRSGRLTIKTKRLKKLPATKTLDFLPDKIYKGEYLVLEFEDTGDGMDDSTKSKMFEPFFTTKFIGRGLGLAAVQGIVHSLEGGIRVRTKREKGTTVTIYLPPDTIK